MAVTESVIEGCVPPVPGTGRALVTPVPHLGEWWASWQGGPDTAAANECFDAFCTTEAEAIQWALAQPAAEWLICRDVDADVWEHLR